MELDKLIESLQIFRKYYGGKDRFLNADHDTVYGPSMEELDEKGLTKEDKDRLEELGWFNDGDQWQVSVSC